MKFALLYEIPVAHSWQRDSEHQAYENVIEQVVLGREREAAGVDPSLCLVDPYKVPHAMGRPVLPEFD